MPKGKYRYNDDGDDGEEGDITPNSYSDDDRSSDRGPTGIEGDYRDEEYSNSGSEDSGDEIIYNKQQPIDPASFDELHQRIVENERKILELEQQQRKEDIQKKRMMEEAEENRRVDTTLKKLKSLVCLSPNKINSALAGQLSDFELTPECILVITASIESVIKAILVGSIEQSQEYSSKVPDIVLGKDNKITLPMIQIALRLSPNLNKLFSNPMLQMVSMQYFDKSTQILLDKYKQILQRDNIKMNMNDDKNKDQKKTRAKLIDLSNTQNVVTPVEITKLLNNCYPIYSIANDGCILLIAIINEYLRLLVRRILSLRSDSLDDSLLLNIMKRLLDVDIVKDINQKYYILKGLYSMNWSSPEIVKIKFQMINSNGKYGKKKLYRINRIDMVRTITTQFYTELRINSDGLILIYNGIQIPDISTPEMLCMEEVTNTIYVANKRWYTLKRRNDAQKGLLNDVNPSKEDEFSCLFQKNLARKSEIKLPNINKKTPKSDTKYENDKVVKERHYGREITLPSNPDEKYKHLHRNRLLKTPQNDDDNIDYSRLESAKHGKMISPKARKPASNRHYRECDNDNDDNIYDLETIDEEYKKSPQKNKSPGHNINKSPIIIRSPKKQQQQETKKSRRKVIRNDDDDDDDEDDSDDSEAENIIHHSPKRFQTLPTSTKNKKKKNNVNVDEYDDYDDVSAEMNGNEIESTLPAKPPKSTKHHHKRKYLIGNELLRRLSELKTTITAILDPTKSNLESLLVNYKNVINNLDKIDTDLLLSDNTEHNGTELSVIPSELKSLYVRINDLNDKTIDRLGQLSELYEEYYNTFIDSREKSIIKESTPVYQPMKESPRVVDTKKEDLFEGIKEEEHQQDSSRPEPSPPKDDIRKLEENNNKEEGNKEKEEDSVKLEPKKSPIEIKQSDPSANESTEEVKTKSKAKPKEKKVEKRPESKASDFKEDYEEIEENNNEEKPEENSDNEIKDDFEEIERNGRVTHKRKSVLENQIFHDNVDACEISDDELE